MKIPNEVLDKMCAAWNNVLVGKGHTMQAAADVLVPYVLAEALKEPTAQEISSAGSVMSLFANRLAALTAKPDPAVDAVKELLSSIHRQYDVSNAEFLAKIVAAVDKARKEAL